MCIDKILKSAFIAAHIDRSKKGFGWELNPIALRMAKPLWRLGRSECNRVKHAEPIPYPKTQRVVGWVWVGGG